MRASRGQWAVAVTLTMVVVVVACTSDDSTSGTTVAAPSTPTEGSRATDDTSGATGGTGATSSTAVTTTAPPAPDGVIVGTPVGVGVAWQTRTVAHRGEFLALSALAGALHVSRSSDGFTWAATPADLAIDGVGFAASTDDELFVSSGWGSGTQPLTVSASTDAGATWSTDELPVPAISSEYRVQDLQLVALAAAGTNVLALGTSFERTDWQRYSIDVLGTDHGVVTGEGGDPSHWTVEFEDGYELTIDLVAIGLDVATAGFAPSALAWTRTDAGWTTVSIPFASAGGFGPVQLVAGPTGFLAAADPMAAPGRTALFSSADGTAWETSDLPRDLEQAAATGGVFLAGGPLGYVLIGETALAFSPDGEAWTTVATFDDLDPDVSGFLSTGPPAGGPAGFAVVFADPSGAGLEARVLTSSDGISWEQVPLGDGARDALVAVGGESILVRPVVDPAAPDEGPLDTSVIETGGGAGGQHPAAMCEPPEAVALVAYDLATGAYRWHVCADDDVWYDLRAAGDDVLYVTDIAGGPSDMLAIDTASGEVLGVATTAEMTEELPDDAAVPMHAPGALDGVRMSAGQDDPLRVFDTETGDLLWSVDDILAYDDVWAVGDGAIYMSHVEVDEASVPTFTVRAYEPRTGDVRWEVAVDTPSYPWWVGGGRVLSMWTDLTVVSTETGEVLWATDYGIDTFPGMRGALANDDTVFVTFVSFWGGGD